MVFMNSFIGRFLTRRNQKGLAQQYIYPYDIRKQIVPILPKSTQQKIADLVHQSHAARQKAKQLLEEAKQKVEDLIEK